MWLCRCDCGNEVLVFSYFLTHGIRRSCGCMRNDSRKSDLAGQRFGRLTAIRATGQRKHNRIVWECLCDCGNVVNVRSDNLVSGETKSCGCLHIEVAAKQAETGIWQSNIRDGTNIKLIQSDKIYSNNTSGCKGVSWHKGVGMWVARIQFQGKSYHLGYFGDIGKAIEARKAAELKYFGTYLANIKRGD